MGVADRDSYLSGVVGALRAQWPANRTVNIVCHGHSFPAGYTETPVVDQFSAYPHLLHRALKERFPFAVINVIVTAVGGECSRGGTERFERDALCHQPDVVTIDYGLNDRHIDLGEAYDCWSAMIESALGRGVKLILMSPAIDPVGKGAAPDEHLALIKKHTEQILTLAEKYGVGFADVFGAYERYVRDCGELMDLYNPNHPNRKGHEVIAQEVLRWFWATDQ